MTLATEVLAHVQALTVTQGRDAGKTLTVLPWEQRFISGAFKRTVSDAVLSTARGQGKTTLLAGVATAALDGPLVQPRGEAIIVASSFDQARIDFEHVLAFMLERHPDLYEGKRWRIQDSANRASITDRETGARVKCIGSDPARAHGLAGVLYLLDEPAQWRRNDRDRMYAAISTSRGKIPGSRLIALGTQSSDSGHWFQTLLNGGADFIQLHAAPAGCNPFSKRVWRQANPSLPAFPDLAQQIAKEAEKAKQDPAELARFCALRLNMGVADVVRLHLLDAGVWQAAEGDSERGGRSIWGLDTADGVAMAGVSCIWESGRLESLAAFPDTPDLEQRSLKDGVGSGADSLYVQMHARGELILTPGRVVRVAALLNEAFGRFGQPALIVADRFKKNETVQGLEESNIQPCPIIWRGQGFRDGAEDVRRFKQAMLGGRVCPETSLLLRAGMAEAMVVADPAGNQKLSKNTEGGRRKNARDDAVAAAILAVAELERRRGVPDTAESGPESAQSSPDSPNTPVGGPAPAPVAEKPAQPAQPAQDWYIGAVQ